MGNWRDSSYMQSREESNNRGKMIYWYIENCPKASI